VRGFGVIGSASCFRRSVISNSSRSRFILQAWIWFCHVWNSVWRRFAARLARETADIKAEAGSSPIQPLNFFVLDNQTPMNMFSIYPPISFLSSENIPSSFKREKIIAYEVKRLSIDLIPWRRKSILN
jgi:hypothetical protein